MTDPWGHSTLTFLAYECTICSKIGLLFTILFNVSGLVGVDPGLGLAPGPGTAPGPGVAPCLGIASQGQSL